MGTSQLKVEPLEDERDEIIHLEPLPMPQIEKPEAQQLEFFTEWQLGRPNDSA